MDDEDITRGGTGQSRNEVLAHALDVRQVPETDGTIEDQLVQLMREHERSIYNFLLALLRDADAALDCAQDTFLRAYENLRKGKPVKPQWLYTVARNRAMDVFRERRRVQPELGKLDQVPVQAPTDRAVAVRSAMERLSPADREVLYLFDVAGFKTEEIGEMLGIRSAAVRQRLSRARERFRRHYGAET
jgi:RNA polymerase sigma-70 factor (ECF subfamily)